MIKAFLATKFYGKKILVSIFLLVQFAAYDWWNVVRDSLNWHNNKINITICLGVNVQIRYVCVEWIKHLFLYYLRCANIALWHRGRETEYNSKLGAFHFHHKFTASGEILMEISRWATILRRRKFVPKAVRCPGD